VARKRFGVRIAFAVDAVLAILALFVFDGPAGGITALVALLLFIVTCIAALRPRAAQDSDRTGLAGWMGGWF
jgi:hypothetical protein